MGAENRCRAGMWGLAPASGRPRRRALTGAGGGGRGGWGGGGGWVAGGEKKKPRGGMPGGRGKAVRPHHLSFISLYCTCLRALGSKRVMAIFSGMVFLFLVVV